MSTQINNPTSTIGRDPINQKYTIKIKLKITQTTSNSINLPTQKGPIHNFYKRVRYNQNVEKTHNNKTTNIKLTKTYLQEHN